MFNSLGTWFRRQPVGRKLTTTALTTSGVALVAACTVLVTYDYERARPMPVPEEWRAALVAHEGRPLERPQQGVQ